jgi:endonuclease/exonuclease/phosphatase (EEP) superfamily protein YafD
VKDIPIILLGDFNEEEGGQAYRYLEEEGLRDARKEFDGAKHTWQWPLLGGWYVMKARYDHLFYSPTSLKCLGAQVIQEGASDHFPVVGRFILTDEEKEEEKEESQKKKVATAFGSIGSRRFGS